MALVTLPSQQDRAEQALAPEVGGRVSMCGGHREAGVPSLCPRGSGFTPLIWPEPALAGETPASSRPFGGVVICRVKTPRRPSEMCDRSLGVRLWPERNVGVFVIKA